MSGVYKHPFSYTGNGNVDLAEGLCASGKPCVILGYNIFQTTDFGDAQEEVLPIYFKRGQTTSGSGGSAVTPAAVDGANGAASYTAESGNTTKASGGTITTPGTYGWNVRTADSVRFTQEEQIGVPAGVRWTMEIGAAADSLAVAGEVLVQELF